jgi:putative endonuclease
VVENLGYEIAETNFRVREGEIDIVARDAAADFVVFIEVKTRTNRAFGTGAEQISDRKAQRLQSAAQRYLSQNDLDNVDWRIDLISLEMSKSGQVHAIEHIQSAIEDQT